MPMGWGAMRLAAAAEGTAADADAGAADGAAEEEVDEEEEGFFLSLARDAESVVGAFFASLLPSWRAYDATGEEPPPPQQQQAMAAGPGANF